VWLLELWFVLRMRRRGAEWLCRSGCCPGCRSELRMRRCPELWLLELLPQVVRLLRIPRLGLLP